MENASNECKTVSAMVMGPVDKFSFIVVPDMLQFGFVVGRSDQRVGNIMTASHFEIIPTFPVPMGNFVPVPHFYRFNQDINDMCDHSTCLNNKNCQLHKCFLCDACVLCTVFWNFLV